MVSLLYIIVSLLFLIASLIHMFPSLRTAASSCVPNRSRLLARELLGLKLPDIAASAPMASSASSTTCSTHVSKVLGRGSIPEDAVSNPHHVTKGKNSTVVGFKNPYPSYRPPEPLKQVLWPFLTSQMKYPDTKPPTVPVVKPEWLPSRFPSTASPDASPKDQQLRATWLGHACYYVEFPSGLRVLFDPVFEACCSPFPFSKIGPRRFTKPPCEIKDIPTVDAVLISHSHYDHLSSTSVLEVQKHHPDAQFFVGLGLEKWFRNQGIHNVTELDWWEDAELTIKAKAKPGEEKEESTISARVSCLPSQHNSARGLFDRDTTLWASWGVYSEGKSVWFAGDTGYRAVPAVAEGVDDYGPEFESLPHCPQFRQIGHLRGPFDLGLIPIGAYKPRAAFSGMHANPFDAVEIFVDSSCRRAMGIHWGTWALTFEDVLEPPKLLKEALRRKGIPEVGVFDVCDIGESREF